MSVLYLHSQFLQFFSCENQLTHLFRNLVHFLRSNISFLFFFQANMLIDFHFLVFYLLLFLRKNQNRGLVYLLYSAIYVNLVFFFKVCRGIASFYRIFSFEIIFYLSSYIDILKLLKSYQLSSNNLIKGGHQFCFLFKSCRL